MPAVASELPTGIVTFVFTDIEGSTRLLHRHGDAFVDILERHRLLLREAWTAAGGYEISADADSFFVAFPDADAAIDACVAGRDLLAAEPWSEGARVLVRMGMHRGLAKPHQGNYVALAVHQAARVMAAARGGQIIVSQQAAEGLSPQRIATLRRLGRFRLRDFGDAPVLYEVPDPTRSFHAPRAVPADGHNIVRRGAATIGREALTAEVAEAVVPGALNTLVGAGGAGKTRVAADVGIRVAPDWDGGVWFVDLAPLVSADLIMAAVAEAVGVRNEPGIDRREALLDHLHGRRMVIVVDNCEHLLGSVGELVGDLLYSIPTIAVVATSREPLRLEGERTWPVGPLPIADSTDPDELAGSPAVELFVERAASARPGFSVTADNVAAVAEICRHLDGLPLFIELAAANVAVQSPFEILAGLENRSQRLRGRSPSLSDRHQTMEGVMEWSYRLLHPAEQSALRRLSIFGASFTLDAANAAVAGGGVEPADVPSLVWSLVDRSLVVADLTANDTRYRLFETVRSYGRALLDEERATSAVAAQLAGWYLERLGPWLPAGRRWVGNVGVEIDNLRSLVPLLAERRPERAQELACVVGRYHEAAQTFRDGIDELGRYAVSLSQPTATRVSLLATLAFLHLRTGDVAEARALVEEAHNLRQATGAPSWDDVAVDRALGEVARRSGDLSGAVELAKIALDAPITDLGRARMLNLLGTTSAALGDMATAYDACAEELELNLSTGREGFVASAHGNLAEIALRTGNMPAAARHQLQCLDLAVAEGSTAMVAFSLIAAARIAGWLERWDTAVQLHAQSEDVLESIGLVLYDDDQREVDALLSEAQSRLTSQRLTKAVSAGRSLSMTEAVTLAEGVLGGAQEGVQ